MTGWLALAGGLFVVLAVVLLVRVVDGYPALAAAARAVAVVCATGGAATLAGVMLGRRWPMAAPAACAATVVSVYLLAAVWALPAANAYKSARPFCTNLRAIVGDDDPLRSYGFWRWRASYVYYADRRIENIDSADELSAYWDSGQQVFLLVERGKLDEVRGLLGEAHPVIGQRIGSNEVYLFTNR
jgi:hypothetical protein